MRAAEGKIGNAALKQVGKRYASLPHKCFPEGRESSERSADEKLISLQSFLLGNHLQFIFLFLFFKKMADINKNKYHTCCDWIRLGWFLFLLIFHASAKKGKTLKKFRQLDKSVFLSHLHYAPFATCI